MQYPQVTTGLNCNYLVLLSTENRSKNTAIHFLFFGINNTAKLVEIDLDTRSRGFNQTEE